MAAEPRRARAQAFRALHSGSEMLVLPGVWDVASARVFAGAGFAALGTTSSGVAWSLGYASGQEMPWAEFLAACERVAAAVEIPVSFDLEAGFGDTPGVVARNVGDAIEAGACGVNLEDGFVDGQFAAAEFHVEKVQAVRELCTQRDDSLFINARTDVYLGGVADEDAQLAEAIRRAQQYVEAGADGIFVPGMVDTGDIATLAAEVPRPVNIYALPGLAPAKELAAHGVRRVSLGVGPLQAALARTLEIASSIHRDGEWTSLTDGWMDYAEAVRICSGAQDE